MNLLSDDHSEADAAGRHTVVLEPYGYRWYRVGGLDYLLKRSESLNLSDICPEKLLARRRHMRCAASCSRLKRPLHKDLPELARSLR